MLTHLNIQECISSLDDASRNPDNPMNQGYLYAELIMIYTKLNIQLFIVIKLKILLLFTLGIPLTTKNIFVDMIKFAIQHTEELLYVILCLTSTSSINFDTTKVIQTAKTYMSIVSQLSPNRNTSFKKL